MKFYRLGSILIMGLLCLSFGLVYAQDATQESSAARPALVPCVEGENIACVQNVGEISAIVGVWRSYIRDTNGIHFGFTVYKDDGIMAVTTDPKAEPTVIGSVTFANGLATITTNISGLAMANCVGAGSYEMRLIRFGDEPVALTYRSTTQNDVCFGRVGGFTQPMLYYPGTGKDLVELDPAIDALAQPLIPCLGLPRPCDFIATKGEDINGYWKSYFSPTPGEMAVLHITDAGSNMLVGNGDDPTTLKEFFPALSPIRWEGSLFFDGPPNATDPCVSDVQYIRVFKFGNQRIAYLETPVQDACIPRKTDFSDAMIWLREE